MKLTQDQMRAIAYGAGWHYVGGFGSYNYADPSGGYHAKLPDYNQDKKRLKEDLGLLEERVSKMSDVLNKGKQALTSNSIPI